MINVHDYYKKIADKEPIPEGEIVGLLKALDGLQQGVAFLASCQAATLEGLPKSVSRSQRQRHHDICLSAAKILQGDITAIKNRSQMSMNAALDRCLKAASAVQPHQGE